jgi:hypothetical protein
LFGIRDSLAGWPGLAISAGLGLVAGFGTLALFYRPDPQTETA